MSRIQSLSVPSWRTCNNRRRKHAAPRWVFRTWAIPSATPLTLDKMRRALDALGSKFGPMLWPDEKAHWPTFDADLRDYGIAITKDGERVDPLDFYAEPPPA